MLLLKHVNGKSRLERHAEERIVYHRLMHEGVDWAEIHCVHVSSIHALVSIHISVRIVHARELGKWVRIINRTHWWKRLILIYKWIVCVLALILLVWFDPLAPNRSQELYWFFSCIPTATFSRRNCEILMVVTFEFSL